MRDDFVDSVTPGGHPPPWGRVGSYRGRRGRRSRGAPNGRCTRASAGRPGSWSRSWPAPSSSTRPWRRTSSTPGGCPRSTSTSRPGWRAPCPPGPSGSRGRSRGSAASLGVTAVVAAAVIWLLTRGARAEAALLVTVAIGIQLIVVASKNGYERPRPDVGSAIALPSSFSFPSGHAATGIAVFGLLGLARGRDRAHAAGEDDRGRRRIRPRRPDRREPRRARRALPVRRRRGRLPGARVARDAASSSPAGSMRVEPGHAAR